MKVQIDRPIAQLILDLEERGLLDRTLIIRASEFSRDMIIEGVPTYASTVVPPELRVLRGAGDQEAARRKALANLETAGFK